MSRSHTWGEFAMVERRDVLKKLATLTAATALNGSKARAYNGEDTASKPTARPNILLFFTDDHGRWLQQAYGNSEVKTPNLERIARNGVLMLNAHTTSPVCSPARASFFTGVMPSQHGIHDWIEEKTQAYAYPWLKGQTLISQLLKDAGYHTGLVGKWHCGEERFPHPGFDEWYSYWVSQYPHSGHQNFSDNGRHVTADGFQSPFLSAQAIAFLNGHFASKTTVDSPFFLFVGYTDTHTPHNSMPNELVAEYNDATFRDIPREQFSRDHGIALIPVSKDPEVERRKHQEYYAAASSVDREVGRVLDALDALGQTDNTIVIYTGDHGLNAGHHGMWEKGNGTIPQNFLEESIMVSCAIAWRNGGIPSGLSLDLPVNHCDLFETLLDLAGALPDAEASRRINSPGRSYLEYLRGDPKESWRKEVFCEYGNARMIKEDGYKLIVRYPFQGIAFENEFYDLKADPRETFNIFKEPEHRERIRKMTEKLNEYFEKYSNPAHDGRYLEQQPVATMASPWLEAVRMQRQRQMKSR
jgi:arylsulfatase A-like enzyme